MHEWTAMAYVTNSWGYGARNVRVPQFWRIAVIKRFKIEKPENKLEK